MWAALPELLREVRFASLPVGCNWPLIAVFLILAFCLGCCFGATFCALLLSPFLRRICSLALRWLAATLEVQQAAPALVHRRLREYRLHE